MVARFVLGVVRLLQEYHIECGWISHEQIPLVLLDEEENKQIEVEIASCESFSDHDTLSVHEEDIQELEEREALEWILVSSSMMPKRSNEWIHESTFIEYPYFLPRDAHNGFDQFDSSAPIFPKED